MKFGILISSLFLTNLVHASPTPRGNVKLPAEFDWLIDFVNTDPATMDACYSAINTLTLDPEKRWESVDAADNACMEVVVRVSILHYKLEISSTADLPPGTTKETLDNILMTIMEAGWDERRIAILELVKSKEALIRELFDPVYCRVFNAESIYSTLLEHLQNFDRYVRHSVGTTDFFGAPSYPAFASYFEKEWTRIVELRLFNVTEGRLPADYLAVVQNDIMEKKTAMYAAIGALNNFNTSTTAGATAITETSKVLADKMKFWKQSLNGFSVYEPGGAPHIEARLHQFEMPIYQPLLNPYIDALMAKKSLIAALGDAEKKSLNAAVEAVWRAASDRAWYLMWYDGMHVPSYLEESRATANFVEAYGKWKA